MITSPLNKIPAVLFTSLKALWRPLSTLAERYPTASNISKILLSTLVPALLKPYTFDKAYQREAYFSEPERKLMMTQESIRQFVSIGLYFGSAVTSWFISQRLFPGQKGFSHLTNTLLGSAVLDTFLRPIITAKLSRFFPHVRLAESTPNTLALKALHDEPSVSYAPMATSHPLADYTHRPALPSRIGNWPPAPMVAVAPSAWTQSPSQQWQAWQYRNYYGNMRI